MKKLNLGIIGLCCIIGLTGCGTTWVNLDNSKASETKIKKASKKCKVDDRIYKINEDQNTRGYIVSLSGAKGKAKKQLIKINKEKKEKDYQVIYKCMEEEGLIQDK